jgi:hypothetical protein
MRRIIVDADEAIGKFMCAALQTPRGFTSGRGIGVVDVMPDRTANIIAGIWFENFNGANMMMHVAAKPQSGWMSKELLWYTFHYPFIECDCRRVTGLVAESNLEARKFDERLGFTLEARLKDAAPDGDLLVYAMFREECRWLKLRERTSALRHTLN